MSLGINTTTSEGIVLAADSRQSYLNQKGMSRVGSDSASKVFKLTDKAGVVVAGLAFLQENGVPKNISRFIEDFRNTHDLKKMTIEDISNSLFEYFKGKYDYKKQLKNLIEQIKNNLETQGSEILKIDEKETHIEFSFRDKKKIEKKGVAGIMQLQFIVSGFNRDDSFQSAMVYVPGKVETKRDSKKVGREYGAGWIGQTDVVSRIVLGFDPRISNLPAIQKTTQSENGEDVLRSQLGSLEYSIQWGTMTLQDAIDFSLLAIETTTAIQRFSDGIKADPGDMPGVGGAVDIAVITREKGFVWISKKKLSVGNTTVDLESLPDLT